MPTRRAIRKKMQRKIQVGDWVTWGNCRVNCKVTEVTPEGVYVDTELVEGTSAPRYFVTWAGGQRGRGPGSSPLKKVSQDKRH